HDAAVGVGDSFRAGAPGARELLLRVCDGASVLYRLPPLGRRVARGAGAGALLALGPVQLGHGPDGAADAREASHQRTDAEDGAECHGADARDGRADGAEHRDQQRAQSQGGEQHAVEDADGVRRGAGVEQRREAAAALDAGAGDAGAPDVLGQELRLEVGPPDAIDVDLQVDPVALQLVADGVELLQAGQRVLLADQADAVLHLDLAPIRAQLLRPLAEGALAIAVGLGQPARDIALHRAVGPLLHLLASQFGAVRARVLLVQLAHTLRDIALHRAIGPILGLLASQFGAVRARVLLVQLAHTLRDIALHRAVGPILGLHPPLLCGVHLALGAHLELPEALELGLLLRGVRVGGRPTLDRLGDLVGLVADRSEVPPRGGGQVALAAIGGIEHPLELLAELADALDRPGLVGDLRQIHLRDAVQPSLDDGELALGQRLRELAEVGLHALDAVAGEL